ncbi:MAG: hypothetical protein WBF13_07545 [Candidatus Zixiibacteriota bacterium]
MSVKPLDFSKPNLVRDFREVKRMFKEDLVEGEQVFASAVFSSDYG